MATKDELAERVAKLEAWRESTNERMGHFVRIEEFRIIRWAMAALTGVFIGLLAKLLSD